MYDVPGLFCRHHDRRRGRSINQVIEFKKRLSSDFAVGKVYLTLMAGGLLMVRLYGGTGLPCLFKAFTHLPCLTCGTTRSLLSFTHFNWQAAVAYNPGLMLFGSLAALFFAADVLASFFGKKAVIDINTVPRSLVLLLVVVGMTTNWAYLIWMGI